MTRERREHATVDPELKRALLDFQAALDEARTRRDGSADRLQVPVIFGPACGGGQRFGTLKPAQLRAMGTLYQTFAVNVMAESETEKHHTRGKH